jgi:hypothetical protein
MARPSDRKLFLSNKLARKALTGSFRGDVTRSTVSNSKIFATRIPRDKNFGDYAYERANRLIARLENKRRVGQKVYDRRSPANKLARTILNRGVDPRALRDKLGKSAIDNMGYMGYGSNNPKKAASRAMKAATVERAMRLADRTARISRTAHQTAVDNFKKNAHLFGPGGQRIKSR